MKNHGAEHYYLGIDVKRDKKYRNIWLSENICIEKILNECGMETCKEIKIPFQVGAKLSTKMFPKTLEKKYTWLGFLMIKL
jgi:hypothetical protein